MQLAKISTFSRTPRLSIPINPLPPPEAELSSMNKLPTSADKEKLEFIISLVSDRVSAEKMVLAFPSEETLPEFIKKESPLTPIPPRPKVPSLSIVRSPPTELCSLALRLRLELFRMKASSSTANTTLPPAPLLAEAVKLPVVSTLKVLLPAMMSSVAPAAPVTSPLAMSETSLPLFVMTSRGMPAVRFS